MHGRRLPRVPFAAGRMSVGSSPPSPHRLSACSCATTWRSPPLRGRRGRAPRRPADVGTGLLRDAEDRGRCLLTEVGFAVDTRRIDKEVEIEIGRSYQAPSMRPYRPSTTLVADDLAIEWLFPHLETDIEIAPLGADQTHLSICGRYEPPWAPSSGYSIARCSIAWPRRPSRIYSTAWPSASERVSRRRPERFDPSVPEVSLHPRRSRGRSCPTKS
jgi:hypothetical protein